MTIYTVTIAISIIVYIAIGNYAGRGIKRLDDYYVAGRRAPTLIIVGTLVASLMVVLGNLFADIAMAAVDPRIRLSDERRAAR